MLGKIKPEELAIVMGSSPQTIRWLIQQGRLPIGICYKKKNDNKSYAYMITPKEVEEYLGPEAVEKIEQMREEQKKK